MSASLILNRVDGGYFGHAAGDADSASLEREARLSGEASDNVAASPREAPGRMRALFDGGTEERRIRPDGDRGVRPQRRNERYHGDRRRRGGRGAEARPVVVGNVRRLNRDVELIALVLVEKRPSGCVTGSDFGLDVARRVGITKN